MSGAQPVDPALFGPCSGLAADSRDNTCTNYAAEYVVWVPEPAVVDGDTVTQGTWMRRLCTPCADLVPDPVERRALTTIAGGYPIPQAALRPSSVAAADQQMANFAEGLDLMVDAVRRSTADFHVDAAVTHLLMVRTTVETYSLEEAAHLLSIAIARLAALPAPAVTA